MDVYTAMALALGPALYWTLDGTTKAEDLSGNGRNGTAQGGLSIGAHGSSPIAGESTATDLDGTDDRITSTYAPFSNGSVLTILGWSWRDASTTNDSVFGGTGVAAPSFRLMSGGEVGFPRFRFDQTKGTAATNQAEWAKAEATGQWVMPALVIDEPGNLGKLYVGGELRSVKEGLTQAYTTPGNFELGAHSGGEDPFDGKMCHVGIYAKELDAATLAALAATAANPGPPFGSRNRLGVGR